MKYIFLGGTNFSGEVLFYLTDNKFWPKAIFTFSKEFQISYCDDKVKNTNFFDFKAVSLFKLEYGTDDGPIIAQKEISINKDDHIKEVCKKATEASKIFKKY